MIPNLTVIKAGSGVLTRASDGTIDRAALVHLVSAIAGLVHHGHHCLFVSSGAVGSGVAALGLDHYPADTATRQACAAVGQARLMETYSGLFAHFDIQIAQILLTAADLSTPERATLVHNTLERLFTEPHIIPIINENDTVAVEELKFGDNDMLAVRVARLASASRIIFLTSVDGLLDPDTGNRITHADDTASVIRHARLDKGKFSMGGMASKLHAIQSALDSGIECCIAHGRHPERIHAIIDGQGICTRFTPPTTA